MTRRVNSDPKISCCICSRLYFKKRYSIKPSEETVKKFFTKNRCCQHCNNIIRQQSPKIVFNEKWNSISILSTIGKLKSLKNKPPCKKCFCCFSTDHDTSNCDDKISTVPYFFLPSIDSDLLHRFIQMLNELEKHFFAFSSKKTSTFIEAKPLIIVQELSNPSFYNFLPAFNNAHILVSQKFDLHGYQRFYTYKYPDTVYFTESIFASIASKTVLINAKFIELSNVEISASNFLLLLSSKTIETSCCQISLSSKLNFSDFIEIVPNLKDFYLIESKMTQNLECDTFGLKKMLKNFKAFQHLRIPVYSLYETFKYLSIIKRNPGNSDLSQKNEQICGELRKLFPNYSFSNGDTFVTARKLTL